MRTNSRKNEEMKPKQNHRLIMDVTVVTEGQSNTVKSNTAQEPGYKVHGSRQTERRAAERRYPVFKDKSGDREDIPHVQGMERRPEEKSHVQGKEQ